MQRGRVDIQVARTPGGSVVVVIRSANLNRCIRPAGDQSTRVVERVLRLQSQRTILSDKTAVVVIDVLPGKLDAFLADHSTCLLRHAEVQTISITEVIAIAVFDTAARIYLQFFTGHDQRGVVIDARHRLHRDVLPHHEAAVVVH